MVGSGNDDIGTDGVTTPAVAVSASAPAAPVTPAAPAVIVDENGVPTIERRGRAGTLAIDEANARLRMPAPRAKDAPQS
ncbi:hypothetical protein H0H92_001980 [Tricholoma furcatifolium]|nr:hypothetical protein H0H92_001980 [Tricholoma furcatifolium]